jgi:hypothetical protein
MIEDLDIMSGDELDLNRNGLPRQGFTISKNTDDHPRIRVSHSRRCSNVFGCKRSERSTFLVLVFEPFSCHLTYAYDQAGLPRPTDTRHDKSLGARRVLGPFFQEWDKKLTSFLSLC